MNKSLMCLSPDPYPIFEGAVRKRQARFIGCDEMTIDNDYDDDCVLYELTVYNIHTSSCADVEGCGGHPEG